MDDQEKLIQQDKQVARCMMTALSIGNRRQDHVCIVRESAVNQKLDDWEVPYSELAMDTRQNGNRILVACLNREDHGRSAYVLTREEVHADITGEKIKMCGYLEGLINEVMPPELSNSLKDQLNWKD